MRVHGDFFSNKLSAHVIHRINRSRMLSCVSGARNALSHTILKLKLFNTTAIQQRVWTNILKWKRAKAITNLAEMCGKATLFVRAKHRKGALPLRSDTSQHMRIQEKRRNNDGKHRTSASKHMLRRTYIFRPKNKWSKRCLKILSHGVPGSFVSACYGQRLVGKCH